MIPYMLSTRDPFRVSEFRRLCDSNFSLLDLPLDTPEPKASKGSLIRNVFEKASMLTHRSITIEMGIVLPNEEAHPYFDCLSVLKRLEGVENRTASLHCVLLVKSTHGQIHNNGWILIQTSCQGKIRLQGSDLDSIFECDTFPDVSMAELQTKDKDGVCPFVEALNLLNLVFTNSWGVFPHPKISLGGDLGRFWKWKVDCAERDSCLTLSFSPETIGSLLHLADIEKSTPEKMIQRWVAEKLVPDTQNSE